MATTTLRQGPGGVPERGQAGIFLALSIPVLFGMLGMVVDFGWAYWRKEAAKTAASAAASAVVAAAGSSTPATQASTACPSTLNTSTFWNVGCDFAIHNGFTNGVNNRTVSIQIGTGSTGIPLTGVAPNKYWVSATVTEQIPALFSWVLGKSAVNVTARSTVGVYTASSGGASGGCVYVMDPSAANALSTSGGNFTTGCGIYVKSTNATAYSTSGGNLTLNSGSNLSIGGGMNMTGGNIFLNAGTSGSAGDVLLGKTRTGTGGTISPSGNIKQNQTVSVSNPFSGMTTPTVASSCQSNPNISGGNSNTISPGTYCGISVSGGNNVQFSSGTYILKSGDLTINGGNFSSTVTNVLVYIPSSNTTGKINITGGNMHWSGLSGNGADGFVFWSDNSAAQTVSGSNININGVMYFPNSNLTYSGGNSTQDTLLTDTLTVTGGNITSAATSAELSSGSSISGTFIVE